MITCGVQYVYFDIDTEHISTFSLVLIWLSLLYALLLSVCIFATIVTFWFVLLVKYLQDVFKTQSLTKTWCTMKNIRYFHMCNEEK